MVVVALLVAVVVAGGSPAVVWLLFLLLLLVVLIDVFVGLLESPPYRSGGSILGQLALKRVFERALDTVLLA